MKSSSPALSLAVLVTASVLTLSACGQTEADRAAPPGTPASDPSYNAPTEPAPMGPSPSDPMTPGTVNPDGTTNGTLNPPPSDGSQPNTTPNSPGTTPPPSGSPSSP